MNTSEVLISARLLNHLIVPDIHSGPSFSKAILLLDDERDITSIMSFGLKSAGFAVDVFNDPIEALTHFELNCVNSNDLTDDNDSLKNNKNFQKQGKMNRRYDLIISDIRMPQMNGFEFVRRITALDSSVKIMLITAYEIRKEEFDKVLPSLRIDALINKPIGMTKLNDLVAALLLPDKIKSGNLTLRE